MRRLSMGQLAKSAKVSIDTIRLYDAVEAQTQDAELRDCHDEN